MTDTIKLDNLELHLGTYYSMNEKKGAYFCIWRQHVDGEVKSTINKGILNQVQNLTQLQLASLIGLVKRIKNPANLEINLPTRRIELYLKNRRSVTKHRTLVETLGRELASRFFVTWRIPPMVPLNDHYLGQCLNKARWMVDG